MHQVLLETGIKLGIQNINEWQQEFIKLVIELAKGKEMPIYRFK